MNLSKINRRMLLVGLLTSSMVPLWAQTQSGSYPISQPAQTRNKTPALIAVNNPTGSSSGWHARAGRFYERTWGVNIVDVRRVASGEMLAFRYVVIDPEKAKTLNDKRNTAYLIDEKTGAKLMVPQMEKVGALRTTATPKEGNMYWMLFANTGQVVKTGSLVDVIIGDLHVNGLTVETK